MTFRSKPIRMLHVVGGMNRGGVETWLMHVLRHIDRERFQMDFLVHTTEPCAYDDEIRALGSKVIPCLHPSQPRLYARNLKRILREHGPYDVVHSHVHHYSGFVLWLAKQAGVPTRIAHSHSDTSALEVAATITRAGYLQSMQWLISQHATACLAASRKAAVALFGPVWEVDPRCQLLYCGIDLSQFQKHVDRSSVRAELGIPENAFVVGHAGRFVEAKNHTFLIEIASELVNREPSTRLLLVGDGPLRPAIEQQVAQVGLSDHVIFAGLRSDVPRLMVGAMDVFLMPSLYEGLPLVGLEAQAAGLPFILSDVITDEVDVVRPIIHRLSLLQPATAWAEAILRSRGAASTFRRCDGVDAMQKSSFNISHSLHMLAEIYATA